jgi:mono/diheme cytochrome c family protein
MLCFILHLFCCSLIKKCCQAFIHNHEEGFMKHTRVMLLVAAVLLLAACGRKLPDEPVPTQQPATPVSVEATAVDQPEATQEAAASDQQEPQVDTSDPFAVRAAAANPTNGEQLFNQPNASGFACVNCHIANSDQMLVGPGFLGLPEHAATRVEGQSAAEYLHNAILHPGDFVVPNYPDMVMPRTYADIFTEDQVYDLVAYLLTLHGPDAAAQQPASQEPTPEDQTTSEDTQVVVITTTPVIIVVTATPETALASSESQVAETETVAVEPTAIGTPDIVVTLASFGFISNGETLFTTALSDGSACSDCHNTNSTDEKNGGPGLLGIPQRAAQNTQAISSERYILDAIESTTVHSNADYTSLLSASQRYDLVAYLMTLVDDGSATTTDTQTAQTGDPDAAIIAGIASGDPVRGQELYNLPNATGFACSACHYPNTEDRLVGPGLLHIPTRAAERVPGESAEIYLYHSIINPGAFVVPDYPDMVMPRTYAEVLSEQDIFDLVAYLLTLNE